MKNFAMTRSLAEVDPQIAAAIDNEARRQHEGLELIASENFVSEAVLEAAGSVFTNPPGDAAGRLIEACGLKGRRVGGVVVSEKHANFFVAEPGARAADVVDLMREVRESVEAATGVRLEPELQLVGFETTVEERRR